MNLQQLQAKLMVVARKNPPSDHVPFAFEKRIMAHLAKPVANAIEMWGGALWRAAAACVVAMALLGGWSYQTASNENAELSQELNETVYAALGEHSAIAIGEDVW
ncbi:MAG: hypothetical protein ABIP71_10510 [Verrucomicrobiota bacterium]